jgi:CrcB protein
MNGVIILCIGIGGFVGSVLRYYAQQTITHYFPSALPFGTLFVNITGCFLAGILFGLSERGNVFSRECRFLLVTGFCGGFTTFSAFSQESLNMIRVGEWFFLSVYICASVILGIASTFLGMFILKSI